MNTININRADGPSKLRRRTVVVNVGDPSFEDKVARLKRLRYSIIKQTDKVWTFQPPFSEA